MMVSSRWTSLLVIYVGLHVCRVAFADNDHSPIIEGQSRTLTCSGNMSQTQNWTLYWDIVLPNRRHYSIATCHSKDRECENHKPQQYIVKDNFTDIYYNTSLTILKVSPSERGVIFHCDFLNRTDDKLHVISLWNFSRVVYPADDTVCSARFINGAEVSVLCETSKVYPAIMCELFQIYEGVDIRVEHYKVNYAYGESNYIGYKTANCSFSTNVTKPGIYKYKVRTFPGYDVSHFVPEAVILTEEVLVAGQPEVRIEQQSQKICAGQNTSRFTCIAYWLPAGATLRWYINSKFMGWNNTTAGKVDNIQYKLESFIEVPDALSSIQQIIKCEALYTINKTDVVINDTIQVKLVTPPKQPYFTYNGTLITGRILSLEKGNRLAKFVCEVKGGSPPVSNMTVKCNFFNSINSTTINEMSYGNSVSFDLYNESGRGICSCSAQHESGCYKLTANFTFYFKDEKHMKSTGQTHQTVNTKSAICYIIVGFVVSTFLIFILGTLMFVTKQGSKLYSNIGRYPSVKQTVGTTTKNEQLSIVVDQINSHLSVSRIEDETLVKTTNVANIIPNNTTPSSPLLNKTPATSPVTMYPTSSSDNSTNPVYVNNIELFKDSTLCKQPWSQTYRKTTSPDLSYRTTMQYPPERSASSQRPQKACSLKTHVKPKQLPKPHKKISTLHKQAVYENTQVRKPPSRCAVFKINNLGINKEIPTCRALLGTGKYLQPDVVLDTEMANIYSQIDD